MTSAAAQHTRGRIDDTTRPSQQQAVLQPEWPTNTCEALNFDEEQPFAWKTAVQSNSRSGHGYGHQHTTSDSLEFDFNLESRASTSAISTLDTGWFVMAQTEEVGFAHHLSIGRGVEETSSGTGTFSTHGSSS